jgi:hypothetical protein
MTPDPTMELAALLPCEPIVASFADLIADLKLSGHSQLRNLIADLEKRGMHVATKRGNLGAGEPVAFVPSRFWKTHQAKATAYIDSIE